MKHLFVPYEIALKLKEKGFDDDCLTYYYESNGKPRLNQDPSAALFFFNNTELSKCDVPEYKKKIGRLSAPLYQQVIDWLFQKHSISIVYQVTVDKSIMIKEIEEALKLI